MANQNFLKILIFNFILFKTSKANELPDPDLSLDKLDPNLLNEEDYYDDYSYDYDDYDFDDDHDHDIFQDDGHGHHDKKIQKMSGRKVEELTDEQKSFYRFQEYDLNADGVVDGLEMFKILRKYHDKKIKVHVNGLSEKLKKLEEQAEVMDKDDKNAAKLRQDIIDVQTKLRGYNKASEGDIEAMVEPILLKFDTNKNGQISYFEMLDILGDNTDKNILNISNSEQL